MRWFVARVNSRQGPFGGLEEFQDVDLDAVDFRIVHADGCGKLHGAACVDAHFAAWICADFLDLPARPAGPRNTPSRSLTSGLLRERESRRHGRVGESEATPAPGIESDNSSRFTRRIASSVSIRSSWQVAEADSLLPWLPKHLAQPSPPPRFARFFRLARSFSRVSTRRAGVGLRLGRVRGRGSLLEQKAE